MNYQIGAQEVTNPDYKNLIIPSGSSVDTIDIQNALDDLIFELNRTGTLQDVIKYLKSIPKIYDLSTTCELLDETNELKPSADYSDENVYVNVGTPPFEISDLFFLEDIRMIQKIFIFRNYEETLNFLGNNSYLIQILVEANDKILEYFPNSKLFLEAVPDPEFHDYQQLVASISTDLDAPNATVILDKFDEEWWLDNSDRSEGMLCINLEFQ